MNTSPQSLVLVALVVIAIGYALWKHVGAAKLKAEMAALRNSVLSGSDPRTVVTQALDALKNQGVATVSTTVVAAPQDGLTIGVPPAAPPVAAPAPVAAPSNPFIAWKAEGLDLYHAILRLSHYPNEAEWAQLVAAGYERPTPPPPDAPADTSVFISGDTYIFEKASGQNLRIMGPRRLTVPVPAGFVGLVKLGAAADSDSHSQAHASINGGQYPRDVPTQTAAFTHSVRFGAQRSADEIVMPTTPMNVVYEIAQAPDSGCAVQLQIYPDA